MKIAKLQITSDLNVDLEMAIDQNKPWHARHFILWPKFAPLLTLVYRVTWLLLTNMLTSANANFLSKWNFLG